MCGRPVRSLLRTPGKASQGSLSLPPSVPHALSPPGGEWGWRAMKSQSPKSRSPSGEMRRIRPADKEHSCTCLAFSKLAADNLMSAGVLPERSISARSLARVPRPRKCFPAGLRPCARFARLCGRGWSANGSRQPHRHFQERSGEGCGFGVHQPGLHPQPQLSHAHRG